jgi:hypothetical protein
MADNIRKVYLLQHDLVARIGRYQVQKGITSEVDAVRRLLNIGVQVDELATDILARFCLDFAKSADVRGAASRTLITHLQVVAIDFFGLSVSFRDGAVWSFDPIENAFSGGLVEGAVVENAE